MLPLPLKTLLISLLCITNVVVVVNALPAPGSSSQEAAVVAKAASGSNQLKLIGYLVFQTEKDAKPFKDRKFPNMESHKDDWFPQLIYSHYAPPKGYYVCKVYGATDFVETIKEHSRYSSRTVTFDSTQSPNRGVVMISPVLSSVSKQELQMLVPTAILTLHPPIVICENLSGQRTPVADWTDLGVKESLPDQYIKEVKKQPK
ncbi:hypothetical protein GGU11DRAFT_344574 [Lentinula aff. detonsa]|nr:hypothetical protein GGU11DRAFT_344574 [Lentinula aff. detonsa]